ncbi:hypothetical protein CEXT_786661 [Caerostris extrusa]|uniref:Uncharacterized protein n=1 Tax=Caerostris extrusa TaxID=172846 RepID=A0AAV4XHR2_CAEEX|nr:hypothetical protein CEXT_786661 [Caerostris extrusa]
METKGIVHTCTYDHGDTEISEWKEQSIQRKSILPSSRLCVRQMLAFKKLRHTSVSPFSCLCSNLPCQKPCPPTIHCRWFKSTVYQYCINHQNTVVSLAYI